MFARAAQARAHGPDRNVKLARNLVVVHLLDANEPDDLTMLPAQRLERTLHIAHLMARFLAAHPKISLEISSDGTLRDIVRERFDAGIRIGARIDRDMVAVRIGGALRATVVAAPSYLAARPRPARPQDLQAHWQAFIDSYFQSRQALRGLVVIMDIRHPLKDYDRQMLGYAVRRELPAHVLLTKADKLSRGAAANTLQAVRMELSRAYGDTVGVQTFSGESKQGVEEARSVVSRWLQL